MIKPSPCLLNGHSVCEHTNGSLHFCQISTRHNGRGLIIDSNLNQIQYYFYEKYWLLSLVISNHNMIIHLNKPWIPLGTNLRIGQSCSFWWQQSMHWHLSEPHHLDITSKLPWIFQPLGRREPFDNLAQNIFWLFHLQRLSRGMPKMIKHIT